MTRTRTLVIATATLAAGSLLLASAAYATVTNPANNPHRIEVLGDDGRTYVDGQDTLPGYDDIECTYIPGASLDFENNRVYYADGQSIPWTEWDRIAGYDKWLAKKNAAAAAAAPSTTTTGASGSSSGSKPAGTSAGTTAGTTGVTEVAAAGEASPSATPSQTPSATPETTPSASPTAAVVDEDATTTTAQAAGASSASGAGRIILIALFALGVITFAAYEIVRRRTAGRTAA